MKIVGISGLAGSGKSTVARILTDRRGYAELSLAGPMKAIVADLFGFSHVQLYGPSAARNAIDPRYGISPRFALQTLGTEFGRRVYPDVWVDRLLREAKRFDRIVVPDVRFQNEIDALRGAGAIMIRVLRAGTLEGSAHASEREQLSIPDSAFDCVIDNRDCSLDDLEREVLRLFPA